MARKGDGKAQGVGDTSNLQFYVENAVSTDSQQVFSPGDPFEVVVVPHSGLVLKPPDESVSLASLLRALDRDPRRIARDHGIDLETLHDATL